MEYHLSHRTNDTMLMKWILCTGEELLVLLGLVRKVRLESITKFKDKSWVETAEG